MAEPNRLLRAARERISSRRVRGAHMSREELAEAVALWAADHDDKHREVAFDANHLGKPERGTVRCPRPPYLNALCALLNATPAELGFVTATGQVGVSDLELFPITDGLSLLHVGEAYAMLGEHRQCERALSAAETAFEKVNGDDPGASFYSVTQLGRLAGSCYLFLGHPERAEPFLADFVGAAATADQLAALPARQRAHVLKANPDQAQLPIRARALREGKLLYMAVPKLADPLPSSGLIRPSSTASPRRWRRTARQPQWHPRSLLTTCTRSI
ncbi:MAG: hypothetical protein ACRDRX_25315 [Pseudonocardiaceae bacterium]